MWEGSCFLSGAGILYDSVLLQQIQACRSDSQLDKQCYPVVQNRNQHGGCEIADPVFFAERQIQTQRNQDHAGDHAELRLYGREGGAPEPCRIYTSPSPRDRQKTRMPPSA